MGVLLATPFSGRTGVLAPWLAAFRAVRRPADCRVVWVDTRPSAETAQALRLASAELGAEYVAYPQAPPRSMSERPTVICRAFNRVLRERRRGEHLVVLESDQIVKPDHVARLVAVLDDDPAVGLAAACQYWRGRPDMLLVWDQASRSVYGELDRCRETVAGLAERSYATEKAAGVEDVGATATGLVALRSSWLDSGYRFRASASWGHDLLAGVDCRAAGLRCVVDWSIKVPHLDDDGTVWQSPMCAGGPPAVEARPAAPPPVVAVTCHRAYLPWLPGCLRSIEEQDPRPAARVLALDGVDTAEVRVPAGWRVVSGRWGSPNPGRTAALDGLDQHAWVTWWDADNLMPAGYLAALSAETSAAPATTGVIYPDLRLCDTSLNQVSLETWPEYDYWGLRERNCIDTASAWRAAAVRQAGGWRDQDGGLDDYDLALRITAMGWTARHSTAPPVVYRTHGGQRHGRAPDWGRWPGLTWTLVLLLAGRHRLWERRLDWLARAVLPPTCDLLVLDNSGNPGFRHMVNRDLYLVSHRFRSTTVETVGQAYRPTPGEEYMAIGRHAHVADLYARAWARITTDYVCTLEDDVFGPFGAIPSLARHVAPYTPGGAAAAVYVDPNMPGYACGAIGPREWRGFLRLEEVQARHRVGFVPGGLTVWRQSRLQQAGPIWARAYFDSLMGWDGGRCLALQAAGAEAYLCGDVRADHLVHGRGA